MDRNSKIKWIGTGITLVGAACTSVNLYPINIILLNIGSVFYITWSIKVKERAILILHCGLMTIYVLGSLYKLFH